MNANGRRGYECHIRVSEVVIDITDKEELEALKGGITSPTVFLQSINSLSSRPASSETPALLNMFLSMSLSAV